LIKAITAADDHEKVFWKRTIEKGDQQDGDLEHAINLMHKHGAIDATRNDALAWAKRAQDALATLPQGQINSLLSSLTQYVVDRIV
jgi:octaprenyl-diphosphate synthase